MGDIEHWMLYPVRSEQIEAADNDDHDNAEWVIRADGPLPPRPVDVVPAEQLRGAVEALREWLDADDVAEMDFNDQSEARLEAAIARARSIAGGQ